MTALFLGFFVSPQVWSGACPDSLSNSPEAREILSPSEFQNWGTQGSNWILRPAKEEDRHFVTVDLSSEQILDMENVIGSSDQREFTFTHSLLPEYPGSTNTVGFAKILLDPATQKRIGSISGYIRPDQGLNPMATIGYKILPEFWNRGIATSALQAVLKVLPHFGIQWAMAACSEDNVASKCVLTKAGFEFWREFHPSEWHMTYRRPVSSNLYFYIYPEKE